MSELKKKGTIDPDYSWQTASSLLKSTLHFSSSFTTTIRTLRLNEAENAAQNLDAKKLNANAKFSASRLFKASSIKAPLYYLTSTFKSSELEDREFITTEEMMALYTIHELSSVLALTFIFNSLRKVCEKEEWAKVSKLVNESVEIGGDLGLNIPEIGFGNGILLSGVRALAPVIFLARNPKMYKNYRRDMKIKKVAYDRQMEFELFGCTHVDIATQMLQNVGFGVDLSTDFYKSLMTLPQKPLDKKPNHMRILLLWVEALYNGRKPPAIYGENEIDIGESVLDQLALISKQVQETGSAFSWLAKGKSSIIRSLAPILYAGGKADHDEDEEEDEGQVPAR